MVIGRSDLITVFAKDFFIFYDFKKFVEEESVLKFETHQDFAIKYDIFKSKVDFEI